ncbi:MAG: hypothetical protein ABSD99_07225 [Candidatus Bathyarchaeia archaeon]
MTNHNEDEDRNSRSYRLRKAQETCGYEPTENPQMGNRAVTPTLGDSNPLFTGHGDAVRLSRTTPITLDANNRVSQIQYVAAVLLKLMQRGVQPMAAYCGLHSVLLFAQSDNKGTY